MTQSATDRKRIRKSFGRIESIASLPNLIDVQKTSYANFLQTNVASKDRTETGLQAVFKSVFPIHDFSGRGDLEFVKYELDEPKYDVGECIKRGLTFAAPVRATLRLVVWDIDEETGARTIRDIKEQDVYMGDLPLMTATGTFVVNGTERVVVSQMHRSPGVFFDHDQGKNTAGKFLFSARIIPYRGSWLDFEFDSKDLVYVRIDRRRKLPITSLLYALDDEGTEQRRLDADKKGVSLDIADVQGMGKEEILASFYETVSFSLEKKGWRTPVAPEKLKGRKLPFDLLNADTKEVVVPAGEKILLPKIKKLQKEFVKLYGGILKIRNILKS